MDYLDFKDLADFCQAEALAGKLSPSDDAVWRSFCRRYSKMFHTPLHVVMALSPADVLLAVYEDQLTDVEVDDNMENLLDLIYTLEDPEYAQEKRDDLRDFIKQAEEEDEVRREKGKPIHKLLAEEDEVSIPKNTPGKLQGGPNKTLPQGGGINLSYLDREENGSGEEF